MASDHSGVPQVLFWATKTLFVLKLQRSKMKDIIQFLNRRKDSLRSFFDNYKKNRKRQYVFNFV